jgi:acyl-CoA dehydrogenase
LQEPTAAAGPCPNPRPCQFELVEMAADVKVGRTFVDKLVADHMEKKNIVVETSMAKFWTTDLANRVADRCPELVWASTAVWSPAPWCAAGGMCG